MPSSGTCTDHQAMQLNEAHQSSLGQAECAHAFYQRKIQALPLTLLFPKESESPTCLINSCDFFQPQKLICKIFICTERAKGSISASWSQTSGPCGGNLRSPCSALRPQGLWSSHWEGSGAVTSLLETHGALTSKKSCHS